MFNARETLCIAATAAAFFTGSALAQGQDAHPQSSPASEAAPQPTCAMRMPMSPGAEAGAMQQHMAQMHETMQQMRAEMRAMRSEMMQLRQEMRRRRQ